MKRSTLTFLSLLLLLAISLLPVGAMAFQFNVPGASSGGAASDPDTDDEQTPATAPADESTLDPAAPASPSPTPTSPDPDTRYGITNTKGVNVREKASAKAGIALQIKDMASVVFIILEDEEVSDTETWFKVEIEDGEDTITGFIRSDLVDELTAEEHEAALLAIEEANKVWVTDTGKRYHAESTCSGMQNAYQLSVTEAKAKGYVPCGNCDAPK